MGTLYILHNFLLFFQFQWDIIGIQQHIHLGFPGISAGKESACNAGDPGLIPGSRSSPGEGGTPVFLGFPGGSKGKESTCNVGDLGLIPDLGRSSGGGHGNPLQYSCLENPHGQRSLAGYSLLSHKELGTTEQLTLSLFTFISAKQLRNCASNTII